MWGFQSRRVGTQEGRDRAAEKDQRRPGFTMSPLRPQLRKLASAAAALRVLCCVARACIHFVAWGAAKGKPAERRARDILGKASVGGRGPCPLQQPGAGGAPARRGGLAGFKRVGKWEEAWGCGAPPAAPGLAGGMRAGCAGRGRRGPRLVKAPVWRHARLLLFFLRRARMYHPVSTSVRRRTCAAWPIGRRGKRHERKGGATAGYTL